MGDYNFSRNPKAFDLTIANGSALGGANLTTFTSTVRGILLANNSTSKDVTVQLNGDDDCTFVLRALKAVGFSPEDGVNITSMDFANSSGSDVSILVLAGVDP